MMSASAATRAGTLSGRDVRRRVYPADEFPLLVDAAVAEEDYAVGVQRAIYAQDTTRPHQPGWYAETVLVVTVNRGWGAAYYRGQDDWAWITQNPQPATNAPELLYDPEAGTNYPPDAAIPVDQLRQAVEEYLQTDRRPTCVEWQAAKQYMIY